MCDRFIYDIASLQIEKYLNNTHTLLMADHEYVWNALNKLTTIIESKYNTLGPKRVYEEDDVISAFRKSNNLIISTGDISDIDGFLALNKYATSGADCLFIMNFPAYINTEYSEPEFEAKNPGLGFKYSAANAFGTTQDETYNKFMKRYTDANMNMKKALTDVAFEMAKTVWDEAAASPKGFFYFCIGGINTINPFSLKVVKNEVLVYASEMTEQLHKLDATEGIIYDMFGNKCIMELNSYNGIYMDFNGSMAFFDRGWDQRLSNIASKIKGVFVMGGVYSDKTPVTMPSIQNVLNRFSCATMNQLYHPSRTADFFKFVAVHNIPTFVITNNQVSDLATFSDAEKKVKTYDGINKFLTANSLNGTFLQSVASLYYNSPNNPPKKPFDFYTALALVQSTKSIESLKKNPKKLFFNATYGITLVSPSVSWEKTLTDFESNLDLETKDGDVEFIINKKKNLKFEMDVLKKLPKLPQIPVYDVHFKLNPSTNELTIV